MAFYWNSDDYMVEIQILNINGIYDGHGIWFYSDFYSISMATLYEKLGGEAAINAVVDKFY